MRGMIPAWLLLAAWGGLLPGAAPPPPETAEGALLRAHKVPTTGPGLLAYLRGQFAPLDETRLHRLVEQLGDDSFALREEASRQLVLLGDRARKALQGALRHKDLEVRHRAAACLRRLDREQVAAHLIGAAVRVAGWRRPPGITALLLDHLPAVEDEALAGHVRAALADLAVADGRANPRLVQALSSDRPGLRREAADALCRGGARDQLPALRKLLADPDRSVRLATALGLVGLHDKEAVPTLIDFMDRPPGGDAALAEEILFRLAGERSPQLADDDPASRVRYRQAWRAWWKGAEARIDLAALDARARPLGYTLIVLLDQNEVLSVDAAGKTRWKFSGVQMVLDAEPLPGDRVLLAEYRGNRVTERNSKGEVLWEKKILAPLVAQRLANGNTFIATKEGLIEVDRAGKEVFTFTPPLGQEIMRARKLPGGDFLLVTQLGTARCYRIDRFGKEVRNFPVDVATSGGRLDVTPRGEVLIPEMNNDRVCVYGRDGKRLRQINVAGPVAALAVPGDRILVTTFRQNRAVEFDRAGKEVWQYRRDTRVTRAVRY